MLLKPFTVYWIIAISLLTSSMFVGKSNASERIRVAVFDDHLAEISRVYQLQGCVDPNDIDINENQMLAEFLLFCLALGEEHSNSIELVSYPVIDRVLRALAKNEVDAVGFGVWESDSNRYKLLSSEPLLESGQYKKGLYTTKQQATQLRNQNLNDFSDKIVVVNQNWLQDWKALSCTGLAMLHIDSYRQMFKLVKMGRADFLPLTFSAKPDLKREVFGIDLYPVHGLKVRFEQPLSFVFNTENQLGISLFESVNQGVAELRHVGTINNVYRKLGLVNDQVENWREIGCL